jgi:hypothetical protein
MNTKPTESERDRLQLLLQDTAAKLTEHFQVVQIFASNLEEGGDSTLSVNAGLGNWNARFGQVREWVVYEEEKKREEARKDMRTE